MAPLESRRRMWAQRERGECMPQGKALALCMPLTCKRSKTVRKDDGSEQEEELLFTHFTSKAHCYHE
jgi:hypothetical protein